MKSERFSSNSPACCPTARASPSPFPALPMKSAMTAAARSVSVDAEASVLYRRVRSSPQVMGYERRSRPAEELGEAATQGWPVTQVWGQAAASFIYYHIYTVTAHDNCCCGWLLQIFNKRPAQTGTVAWEDGSTQVKYTCDGGSPTGDWTVSSSWETSANLAHK